MQCAEYIATAVQTFAHDGKRSANVLSKMWAAVRHVDWQVFRQTTADHAEATATFYAHSY